MSGRKPSELPGGEAGLARALRSHRPAPARTFGDRLRERLLAEDAVARRPARLRLLVPACLLGGTLVLIVAAFLA